MSKISGFRDYLPADEIARQGLIDKARAVFELFGFSPLQTPAVESPETLAGKYGGEGDKLIFNIMRRGDELNEKFKEAAAKNLSDDKLKTELQNLSDMCLRYDLTVPLARVIAEYRNEIPLPFKRYQIAPVWRAESPQKGRYREFYQCDFDIVGSRDLSSDAEIILMINSLMQELGVQNYTIKINNRKILTGLMQVNNIAEDQQTAVFRILDKLEKTGKDQVTTDLRELGLDDTQANNLTDTNIENLKGQLASNEIGKEGFDEVEKTIKLVSGIIGEDTIAFDPTLVRGLDYYTGNIFEVALNDKKEFGSVMGGGRYDNLIGNFSNQQIPAVGCSIGFDRLVSALETEEDVKTADYFIAIIGEVAVSYALKVSNQLREKNKSCFMSSKPGAIGDQLSCAEKMGFEKVIIVGENEAKDQTVTVKDLKAREQKTIPAHEIN